MDHMDGARARRSGHWPAMAALAVVAFLVTGCEPIDSSTPAATSPPAATPTPSGSARPTPSVTPSGIGALTVTRDGEISITDASQTFVHCDGGGEVDVRFAGTITITGSCEEIDIFVDGATVTLETSRDVDIEGSRSRLTAAKIDDLDIVGDDNVVTVQSVEDIDVEGSKNIITYGSSGPASVKIAGSGNTVVRD